MKITTLQASAGEGPHVSPLLNRPEQATGTTWDCPTHVHVDPATGVSCVVYGYVVGYPAQQGNSPLGELICRLYREQGPETAFRHNGVYAIQLSDPAIPACFLAVDKFGMYPLYFARDGTRVVASSSIAELLPQFGTELDVEGVDEYLALGYPLGARTLYRSISRAEAGTYFRIDESGASASRRYWWVDEIEEPACERGDGALQRNIECFREVMADHVRDVHQPICFLSSGYDSRRIFLELRAQGVAPDTYTMAIPAKQTEALSTIEPRVVEALTARNPGRGLFLPFPQLSEMVDLVERREQSLGFECGEHEWIIPLIDSVPDGRWHNFDGLAGDTLCNADLAICGQADVHRYADTDHLIDVLSGASYRRYFKRDWIARERSTLRERVREFIESVPPSPSRLLWIELLGRARRSTGLAGMGLHRGQTSVRFPYLDDRMVANCSRLDPKFRQEGSLQRLALDAAYPEFAAIPTSHSPSAELDPSFIDALDEQLELPVAGVRTGFSRPEAAALIHAARYPVRSNVLNWRGRLLVACGRTLVNTSGGKYAARLLKRFWTLPQLVKIDRLAAGTVGRASE